MSKLASFLKDESGASAAEYALILALVGLGIVGATKVLASSISGAINNASACMNSSVGTCNG